MIVDNLQNDIEAIQKQIDNRFGNAKPEAKQLAKQVGQLLADNKKESAKRVFTKFAKDNGLLQWEQLALADLCSLERLIAEKQQTTGII